MQLFWKANEHTGYPVPRRLFESGTVEQSSDNLLWKENGSVPYRITGIQNPDRCGEQGVGEMQASRRISSSDWVGY